MRLAGEKYLNGGAEKNIYWGSGGKYLNVGLEENI
jgi:hypothetical protein